MAAAVHGLVREPFDGVGVAAGKGDGQLVGAGEVAEQLGDLVAQFGVETGGRLVREQDVGAAGRAGRRRRRRPGRPGTSRAQGSGEGDTALLSSGEGAGAAGGEAAVVREAHLGEEGGDGVRASVDGEFTDETADPHPR